MYICKYLKSTFRDEVKHDKIKYMYGGCVKDPSNHSTYVPWLAIFTVCPLIVKAWEISMNIWILNLLLADIHRKQSIQLYSLFLSILCHPPPPFTNKLKLFTAETSHWSIEPIYYLGEYRQLLHSCYNLTVGY